MSLARLDFGHPVVYVSVVPFFFFYSSQEELLVPHSACGQSTLPSNKVGKPQCQGQSCFCLNLQWAQHNNSQVVPQLIKAGAVDTKIGKSTSQPAFLAFGSGPGPGPSKAPMKCFLLPASCNIPLCLPLFLSHLLLLARLHDTG